MNFDIRPGAKAQHLYRDDKTSHVDRFNQIAVGYYLGSDLKKNIMIPGAKTT